MRRKPARPLFMMTTLISEAFVVLFAGVVANGLDLVPSQTGWLATLGIMTLAFVAAGLSRGSAGVWVGWLVQALLFAIAFLVPVMWFLALIFTGLWIASLHLGARIDRERAERDAVSAT